MGRDVHVVAGSERNLKITRPGDMQLAEYYLREERAAP
jgi:2-C-methyl-D-erythritol 4-phosphate cytidylyltransferase